MKIEYFDSHAHYDDEKFNEDRESIIQKIYDFGVTKIVSNGYSLQGSKDSLKLSNKYKFIYSTVGISPNDLGKEWINDIEEIKSILENELKENEKKKCKIVAIGEIGLDYHYDTNREIQKKAFIKQIEIANKYNLPITIHTREAVNDTIKILKEIKANNKGIFHCCPLNRELIKEALKLGFYISLSGTVTFKNSKNAEEIVQMIPIEKMLVETDSPYLSPEPARGSRNNSMNLQYIVKKIAQFRNMTEEQIAKSTYQNAKKIYNIQD